MLSRSRTPGWWIGALVVALGCVGGTVCPAFGVSLFHVVLDTSALSGTAAQLAFDLVDSDPAANVATITEFSADGPLGAAATTGGPVTGALPGTTTIADTAFFNELLQDITLKDTITFTLELTTHRTGGGLPDQFALFLLDAFGGFLFTTNDPSPGSNALFAVDITGTAAGELRGPFIPTSSPAAVAQVNAVPEPATIILMIAGLAGLAGWRCGSYRLCKAGLGTHELG